MFDSPQAIAVALRAHRLYHSQLARQDTEKTTLNAVPGGLSDDEALERRIILQRSYVRLVLTQLRTMGKAQILFRGQAETVDLLETCAIRAKALLRDCNELIQAVRQADSEDRTRMNWPGPVRTAHKRTDGDALAIQSEYYDEVIAELEETLTNMHDQYWNDELEMAHCGRH